MNTFRVVVVFVDYSKNKASAWVCEFPYNPDYDIILLCDGGDNWVLEESNSNIKSF